MSTHPTTAIQPFEPQNLDQAERLATTLAKSALLPDGLKGRPSDVLVTIITGHELGLSPMQAVRGLHVIKGKAVMSADLAVALVKRHPDCVRFRLVHSDDKRAEYETERRNEGVTKMAFTIEQARQAGLGGDNWRKYPAAMLRARAASALARAVYPDLMLGVLEEGEEISDVSSTRPPPAAELNATPPPTPTAQRVDQGKPRRQAKAAKKEEPEDAQLVDEPPPPGDADAPPHDPETGEVTEPADDGAPPAQEQALIAIREAERLEDLQGAVRLIKQLGLEQDQAVRRAYQARQAELREASR